jgi:putative membrane protein
MHMYYWGGWWWWGWIWFWVIVAIILILVLSSRRGGYRGREYRDTAEDIVRQRYARGEINKEQFEQLLQDLRSH